MRSVAAWTQQSVLFALCLGAVACSDSGDAEDPDPTGALKPPAAGQGVQFKMQTTIEPGAEVEHCQFFTVGDEDLYVNRDEIRFSSGSHHVLLYLTSYDEVPTKTNDDEAIDPDAVFDCSEGVQSKFDVAGLIGGSQNATGNAMIDLPKDTAITVKAGTVLLMNSHYINTTNEPIEPEVRINLHTIEEQDVKREGGVLFWYNPFIHVGKKSSSFARMGCTIPDDINISTMQSHMHRRGVDYVAELYDGDKPKTVYETTAWEDVPVTHHSPAMPVSKGSRIEFECRYENTESRDIWQGPRTTDEMCMLLGSYYPKRKGLQFCLGAANWRGDGDVSCKESLDCVRSGFLAKDRVRELTACVSEAKPDVSLPLGEAMGCLIRQFTSSDEVDCTEPIAACDAQ